MTVPNYFFIYKITIFIFSDGQPARDEPADPQLPTDSCTAEGKNEFIN